MMTRQIMGMLPYVFCRISADIHLGLATQQQKKKKKKGRQFSFQSTLCRGRTTICGWPINCFCSYQIQGLGDWLNSHITDEKKI